MGAAFNPYEAPTADGEASAKPAYGGELVDVSRGIRFAHLVVDSFIRVVLGAIMGVIVGTAHKPLLGGAVSLALMIGYNLFFEGLFQATPAKMITHSRVVDLDGNKPSFWQILGRTFARLVPFDPLSFFSSTRYGWHDRWSGTRVVRR